MAKEVEKKYDRKTFMGKIKGVASKFNNDVAAAAGYTELPKGRYSVQLHELELKNTKTGVPMIVLPYTVTEGEFDKKKGSIFITIDPKRAVKEGDNKGVPMGLFDLSRTAKSIGVPTMDDDGEARSVDEILEDMETVTGAEPFATLEVAERIYKKDGKDAIAINKSFIGLVEGDDATTSDAEETEEAEEAEETEEEEAEEPAEPAFAVGATVKYMVGRKQLKGVVRKINPDGTYNIMGQDKKLVRDVTEDKVSS